MHKVLYGNKTIEYTIQEKNGLKSHYITVERGNGVVLKGEPVSIEKAQRLILKKAKWIIEKLNLVETIEDGDIVTGSRIQYLGRRYYTQLFQNDEFNQVLVEFNESKFKITVPEVYTQEDIHKSLNQFFKEKAAEKFKPRLLKWSKETGLDFNELKLQKLQKRWGSCTPSNNIIINIDVIKLPWSLIDYVLIHELVHTKIKNHSKEFWSELSKYLPDWKKLDERMLSMKL
ncbi:M48 family metallopeptidase [Leeuwenhoekiella blandensis]|uniref:M48 family metallopeptidase n=1 Tax=Leeuwenhoekiella blandensis TaxID=360293 RepID=UPI000C45B4BA|nr:SprT family zinc-dependent metalloprotease [Leeuwenhoekiella blandensis]MBM09759.1 metal-dependent hydrolase [Magnetovibrio sp.]|tara:strand:+ start:1238 stop:1927 length:690 start_codon:yes stop_codon:yes gene_type:complete